MRIVEGLDAGITSPMLWYVYLFSVGALEFKCIDVQP